MRDFVAFAADVHRRNAKWWFTEDGVKLTRDPGELLMLAASEVAEAMEGVRKSKPGAPLMDDKLPHRPMVEVELADTVIRLTDSSEGLGIGLYVGLIKMRTTMGRPTPAANLLEIVKAICGADDAIASGSHDSARHWISTAIALCYDYAEQYGHDLDGAIDEKMAYNDNRADHSYAARKAAGGKAF
ncbi:putative NTP pyrophosphohydrolase MazG-like protein [Rhizobium phage RHph_TM3_3_9]|nr:putative NTP pyrophosphohydrolase MazG-like protein [Rhizobium phage RHph_TM3_3_9]QIG67813.1 putative NTP pyrophosphohydrolase MazG-like protein [Rhizobium phage RHph_Y60]QIG68532.1 putative NTP pyrophosphohydrolase MazG-like protein [Rhizobium phage RHph_TM3_3_13]QIG74390.1 putative NTP pyrophosphohydrolase MazG-like protein [Rhizobium phage RHph_TM3_3_10]QXV74503.1 putative NTP pyrophosphohydrolase MazG-like protein [Rhizobium phage RHEph19]